jgi:hypothetical protein
MTEQGEFVEIYRQASIKTANDLRTIAASADFYQLSHLSLPEIEHLTDEVARVVPAGNVPGIILSGLARLEGREVSGAESQKQIGLLFKGVRQVFNKAVYGAFFAGPAAVLYGYQQLLRLAGKNTDTAFPNGTWQFYLEFALREDSARHANETIGFHQQLAHYDIHLSKEDMLVAWVLASAFFFQQLPQLLANEWYERVALKTLADIAARFTLSNAEQYRDLYSEWERVRPYQRGSDAGQEDYATFRRRMFRTFLKPHVANLPPDAQQAWNAQMSEGQNSRLPAYQQQMTWLAYLDPGPHNETRIACTLEEACIGVIWQGRYYLLPVTSVSDPETARSLVASLFSKSPTQPVATIDDALVTAQRATHPELRQMLDDQSQQELEWLRRAPILINWDEQDAQLPLALVRQGKRGIGDHPLTIFRTNESIVFDQSHIFFDGIWGAAVAEIMTNEALSWAAYLMQLSPPQPAANAPYSPTLASFPALTQRAQKSRITAETGVENTDVRLAAIMALRKLLKQRSDLSVVTVNDLLVLYRGLHARLYIPSPDLQQALSALSADLGREAERAYSTVIEGLEALQGKNPAILIPLDGSRFDPRERLFPTTFRNPLTDFYEQHIHSLDTLRAYRAGARGRRSPEFQAFYEAQLTYLRLIGGFGEVLSRYRNVAMAGQSTSTASIRFLGHLPPVLQKLLDTIPGKFDVLNEIIKGEEVFSNMGRVAKGSTLRRFITAKDDNDQKMLAWGAITDDNGVLHLSLRDFRQHVAVLQAIGMSDLAQQITQDYLDSYARGLNQYVAELRDIVIASRETRVEA